MGNLMSCVLICGAVEVVHVVHSDGHVERLIRPLSKIHKNSSHNKCLNSSSFSSSSPPRADLMKCLANLGRSSSGAAASEPGHSYLLLPITNADDSSGALQYKRLSSFQFYKSAFLSPKSSSSSSAPSKSLVVAPKEKNQNPSDKNGKTRRSTGGEHDDRKQLLKDSSQQPFKVRQEGGVTKLVVSKKYLQQLLSESNVKKSSSSSSKDQHDHRGARAINGSSSSAATISQPAALPGIAPPRVGRPGIWRPALESISEAAAAAAAVAAHHPQEP